MPETADGLPLVLSHISKAFGATSVLEDVSFTLRAGTVHALLGENGAGKTTLMRIAFGLLKPDEGTLIVAGATGRVESAADAIRLGIGMVHQHFTNVPQMSVAENVALGGHGRFDFASASRRVKEIAERSGLVVDPTVRAADLSVGGQQRLEIVKALARNAQTLILDEPTAVLAPAEAQELLAWLRRFADEGNAVVLITHKLHEALAIADDVTVLRRGRVAATSTANDATVSSLTTALLGETPTASLATASTPTPSPTGGERVVVAATGIHVAAQSGRGGINDVSLAIHAGEIVGIAAIEGAGQRELLRALAGRAVVTKGALSLPESIGFVPEDRHRDAMALSFSLAENVGLKDAGRRRGRLGIRALRERTAQLVRAFDVRGADVDGLAATLSGGNQQKLVLARELEDSPDLLVVENPTRGLDIRASGAVHNQLRAAARAGAAVVVYSSDIDEVVALSTRVVAVHHGRVRECLLDRDVIGRAMLGLG